MTKTNSFFFFSDSKGYSLTVFFESDLISNPIVGVMLGVLVTVVVQSSSTSTSIMVGLVAAGAPVSRWAILLIWK